MFSIGVITKSSVILERIREPNPRIRQTIKVVPILRAACFFEIDLVLKTTR